MTRLLPMSRPVPCEQDAITEAVSGLEIHGGITLGFVVERPEGLSDGREINEHVARCLTHAAMELSGASQRHIFEDTKWFPSKTLQHVDGLHIDSTFTQVHTTHDSDFGVESYVMLRARDIDPSTEEIIRNEAKYLARQGVEINGLVDVPLGLFAKLKTAPVVARQPLLAGANQSIVFINGCPAASVGPIGRVASHEFSTALGGDFVAAHRLVSFSRVETAPEL